MVLPNALLLPNTLLPLRIFEEHYREMLDHALGADRVFCVALLKPNVQNAASPDDFFNVACLGLIRASVREPDGTSNLILQGVARVQFTRFVQEEPFYIARIRQVKSKAANLVESEALAAKVLELCEDQPNASAMMSQKLKDTLPYLQDPDILSDVIASAYIHDPYKLQRVLDEPLVSERLRMLIKYLRKKAK